MRSIDVPDRAQIRTLAAVRSDACVSLWVRTTPVTVNVEPSRIEFKNLLNAAMKQVRSSGIQAHRADAIEEFATDLYEDHEFWKYQSESLAVFLTPDSALTFRLPNRFASGLEVSDRFHVAPLLRTLSFPHLGYVLALSQNSVRFVEITASAAVDVSAEAALPAGLSVALARAMPRDAAPAGRIQGAEGQKVLVRQFARRVDAGVRSYLAGRSAPLVVAAVEHVASIYRAVSGYPGLLPQRLDGNFDRATPAEIAESARPLLSEAHEQEAANGVAEYKASMSAGLALNDLADIARAATRGVVRKLWICIENTAYGVMDDTGEIVPTQQPSAASYDLIGETAVRVMLSGGEVAGLRRAQMPGASDMLAILRYA